MKTARKSFGDPYECVQPWDDDIFVQCGGSGVVFKKDGGSYKTAFFEAFPKTPSCFIRGEGDTIEEAEKAAWDKYQKILTCEHEMERRNRTDGYGYCKHCSYSSMVFTPLTKCKICNVPTAYTRDKTDKHYYCKKHARLMPIVDRDKYLLRFPTRIPRKLKKQAKIVATMYFEASGIIGKVKQTGVKKYECGDKVMSYFLSTKRFIQRTKEGINKLKQKTNGSLEN